MFLALFDTEPAVHLYRNGSLLPCHKSNSKASAGWRAAASCIWPDELLLGGKLEDAASHRSNLFIRGLPFPFPHEISTVFTEVPGCPFALCFLHPQALAEPFHELLPSEGKTRSTSFY